MRSSSLCAQVTFCGSNMSLHKIVLCSSSFFRAVFSENWKPAPTQPLSGECSPLATVHLQMDTICPYIDSKVAEASIRAAIGYVAPSVFSRTSEVRTTQTGSLFVLKVCSQLTVVTLHIVSKECAHALKRLGRVLPRASHTTSPAFNRRLRRHQSFCACQ
jgi:hypothetical protein